MTSPLCFPTSESLFKLLIPVIGSATWKSPAKTLPVLPGTNWRTNLTTSRPRRVRVLPSLNRRTQTCLPAWPQAKEAPRNPRSRIPTYHQSLGKTASLPLRKGNAILTKTFVSSVVHQDIWLKIVQKALPLPWKLVQPWLLLHPSQLWLQNLRNRKKTKQSMGLHTTQVLHWTPSCKDSHTRRIHSLWPRFTYALTHFWLYPRHSP